MITVFVFALVLLGELAFGVVLGIVLPWLEQATAAWFGPRGFASVIYGLMLLRARVPGAEHLFHVVALVIFGSILVHSSTDVLIARSFRRRALEEEKSED